MQTWKRADPVGFVTHDSSVSEAADADAPAPSGPTAGDCSGIARPPCAGRSPKEADLPQAHSAHCRQAKINQVLAGPYDAGAAYK